MSGKRSNQTCTLMVSYGKGAGLIKINQILRWKRKYPNWRQVDVVGTDVPKFCYSGKHSLKIIAQLRFKEKQFWSFQLLPVRKNAWKHFIAYFHQKLVKRQAKLYFYLTYYFFQILIEFQTSSYDIRPKPLKIATELKNKNPGTRSFVFSKFRTADD